ncbi:MAG TPA: VPDSG-CTERM sorting domain-containing protein [Verrucomicrobiae bacterium]
MNSYTKTKLALTAAALLAAIPSVQAIPSISGSIDFNGLNATVEITGATGDNPFLTGTGFDFSDGTNIEVAQGASGTYAGLVGEVGTISDFSFDPLGGGINPVWLLSVGGFSFSLDSILNVARSDFSLGIEAAGTASGTGFSSTPGTFYLSIADDGGITKFGFSAGTVAEGTSVPDGGSTVMLAGVALLGIAAVRRKLS